MKTFIKTFTNVVPEKDCLDFLEKFKKLNLDQNGEVNFDGEQKEYMNLSNHKELADFEAKVISAAKECVSDYLKDFEWLETKFLFENAMLLKLEKGKGLPLHHDNEISEGGLRRNFIVLMYLQEMLSGGDLCFPKQSSIIKPEPGLLVIAPTFFTHPHFVLPTFEDRYTYRINFFIQNNTDDVRRY